MILKPPQSPNKKPPGRTSFIQRKDTRTSFIGVPGNSSGNSSDEEQRPTRVTFTGRKTIGEKASIDDDLEDILATQIRKSMIQARFLQYRYSTSNNLKVLKSELLLEVFKVESLCGWDISEAIEWLVQYCRI